MLDQLSPDFGGQKYLVPDPTHCPDCRAGRRSAVVNEFHLYPSQCALCQGKTLSQYPPHSNMTVYCRECWHSDKWDSLSYGRDFDFSRSFFEQFHELKKNVPAQALSQQGTMINSEYTHLIGSCKNCYLIMHADFCENCYYSYGFKHNKYCVDGFYNLHSELCYDCVDVHKCYGLIASQDCVNSSDSAFLRDCVGVKDSFLCTGLRQKQYCFQNKQLTKEQYEQKMVGIDLGSHEQYQRFYQMLQEMQKGRVCKEYQGTNIQNSIGDHLNNCKDCYRCYDCEDVEAGRYVYQVVLGSKNVMDIYQYGTNLQASYECSISGENSYGILFGIECHMSSSNLLYCWYMESCHDCFGCVYMHHKRYCIFNKQYTKEEYERMVERIVEHMVETGEWGEFFPISVSPFGYNKTTAFMYYPLEKEEVLARGWKWDEYENPVVAKKTIPANRLPDNIKDIPDDILNWAIVCEITGQPFKITPQELSFYRDRSLPIPHLHPYQRHLNRFKRRNPRHLYPRQCAKCHAETQTTYSPDRPEVVYCEHCYLKNIY
ncbi:hypothetical protein COY07_02080 [Candidatus Peregrinibacteria bacterium CG_4_10_14_0_2_um_filter_43_11]|nr:MAG: hypothetical protein COY07_02080 [Candidatus Peregrinibacteria bacterium CG_4_10_14_0_2_um_filter_43_11]